MKTASNRLVPLPQKCESVACYGFRWMVTHLPWATGKGGTSQAWKKKKSYVFSVDGISTGTWHLCSSGSSLVWPHLPTGRSRSIYSSTQRSCQGKIVFWWQEKGAVVPYEGRKPSAQLPQELESAFCVLPKLLMGQTERTVPCLLQGLGKSLL